jgi:hypothetical protein
VQLTKCKAADIFTFRHSSLPPLRVALLQAYFMIGFTPTTAKFWYYYLMTTSTLLMMTSLGLFLVAATSMVEVAQLLSSALTFLYAIFNGELAQLQLPALECPAVRCLHACVQQFSHGTPCVASSAVARVASLCHHQCSWLQPFQCSHAKHSCVASSCCPSGFTITYSSIPNYWKWANCMTPMTYAIYGLGASQLGDNDSPLVGPGLAASTTVSKYLEAVYDYDYGFR